VLLPGGGTQEAAEVHRVTQWCGGMAIGGARAGVIEGKHFTAPAPKQE
jgi:hypothetical protein